MDVCEREPQLDGPYPPEDHDATATRNIRSRILNTLPAAEYHMDRFLSLVDVTVSDRTPSACVEAGPQPILYVNPRFLESCCQTDEHLLMLVLHELYHVTLGHTRLFPRLSPLDNIAFDAVINALLCRRFPERPYVSFFQNINPSSRLPGRLLRPPEGWPDRLNLVPEAGEAEQKVMTLLYGQCLYGTTYEEIRVLLRSSVEGADGPAMLVGDHREEASRAPHAETLEGIVRETTQGWPLPSGQFLPGRGLPDPAEVQPRLRSPRAEFLEALAALLAMARVVPTARDAIYEWRRSPVRDARQTVLPNAGDRLAAAKSLLYGVEPVLFASEATSHRPRLLPRQMAHVYVDVSGSMETMVGWLLGALEPLVRRGVCRLYAFSTVVADLSEGRRVLRDVRTTYGTNIDCVLQHLAGLRKDRCPGHAVVLTDGWFDPPAMDLLVTVEKRKVRLHAGIVGGYSDTGLQRWAHTVHYLPQL